MVRPDLSCPVDNCCDGVDCLPEVHRGHHTFFDKLKAGFRYALFELWGDIAPWFLLGLLLAGVITALIPSDLMTRYLGGGLPAMLIMLAVGIPLYICATASTPIAAALILKGVSPGAALVFLLTGPATNVTSLTVLFGLLGKRATAIYLASIAVVSVAVRTGARSGLCLFRDFSQGCGRASRRDHSSLGSSCRGAGTVGDVRKTALSDHSFLGEPVKRPAPCSNLRLCFGYVQTLRLSSAIGKFAPVEKNKNKVNARNKVLEEVVIPGESAGSRNV